MKSFCTKIRWEQFQALRAISPLSQPFCSNIQLKMQNPFSLWERHMTGLVDLLSLFIYLCIYIYFCMYLFYCACACIHVHMCHSVQMEARDSIRSWFSLSIVWAPGTELRSSGSYHLSHLTSPCIAFQYLDTLTSLSSLPSGDVSKDGSSSKPGHC